MRRGALLLVAAVLLISSMAAMPDEVSTAGRAIIEQNENAVVTIRLVVKTQYSFPGFGSEDEESIVERTGTVIDPSGLTVVSLTGTDPADMFWEMMEGMGQEEEGLDFRTELTDVKILREGAKEIPARVVLRDRDLDLAFLRPTSPLDAPMKTVDLTKASSPERLDQLIVLHRMGKVAGRACATALDRVQAVSTKPRLFYFLSDSPAVAFAGFSPVLGGPAFTLDGSCAGIVVLRKLKAAAGDGEPEIALVVLPAKDVLDVAQQAPSVEQAEVAEKAEQSQQEEAAESQDSSPALQIQVGPDGKAE